MLNWFCISGLLWCTNAKEIMVCSIWRANVEQILSAILELVIGSVSNSYRLCQVSFRAIKKTKSLSQTVFLRFTTAAPAQTDTYKHRQTQTDHTDIHRQTQTDRYTDTQTYTDRQSHIHTISPNKYYI